MTADDLRALSAAATTAPWRQSGPGDHAGWVFMADAMPPGHQIVGSVIPDRPSDAELVVWLRNRADAIADLIDFVESTANAGCAASPTCIESPPRSGLMCVPCSASRALDALEATP